MPRLTPVAERQDLSMWIRDSDVSTNKATVPFTSHWGGLVLPSNLSSGPQWRTSWGVVEVAISHPGFAPSEASPLLWSISLQEIPDAVSPPSSSISLPALIPCSPFHLENQTASYSTSKRWVYSRTVSGNLE